MAMMNENNADSAVITNGGSPSDANDRAALEKVASYWNTHLNTMQFLDQDAAVEEGSREFFSQLEAAVNRFGYKTKLFDWMASLPGEKVLEIGCGLGHDLCQLARRGLDATAVDIAPRAVELAQKHLAVHGLPGDVALGNCEALDFADDSFDVVYSSGVIQHTPDINAAVREILRVLRPGGTLVIILYYRYSWFRLLSKVTGTNIEFSDADAPIIRTFSRTELRRLFSDATDVQVTMEHYRPAKTVRRGLLAALFNRIFVPCYGAIPDRVIRPFGWHAVVVGQKPSP